LGPGADHGAGIEINGRVIQQRWLADCVSDDARPSWFCDAKRGLLELLPASPTLADDRKIHSNSGRNSWEPEFHLPPLTRFCRHQQIALAMAKARDAAESE
jgi:hypothetical protein